MIKQTSLTSVSPSFTSQYSSNNLADIAARVVAEFRNDDDEDIYNFDDYDPNQLYEQDADNLMQNENEPADEEEEEEEDENKEFEFAVICTDHNSSTASPDPIFFRYPLFDRSLLLNNDVDETDSNSKHDKKSPVTRHPIRRKPLRKLFNEERETASCSSSESDDLDGVSPETYCIWKPKEDSVKSSRKSNSTGSSSKRWKFRNLVTRSHSDVSETAGKKDSVIIFRQLTATKNRSEKAKKVEKTSKVAGEPVTVKDEIKEGNRIKSYLPYKRDLVGGFANVNGLSRNLHPF